MYIFWRHYRPNIGFQSASKMKWKDILEKEYSFKQEYAAFIFHCKWFQTTASAARLYLSFF